jgi:hypothetical protein
MRASSDPIPLYSKNMTKKEAIAFYLCWDINDIEWYQPLTMSHKVVALESEWIMATKSEKKPILKTRDLIFENWIKKESIGGWVIWSMPI